MTMEPQQVRDLERAFESAIAGALRGQSQRLRLRRPLSPRAVHLMAKAAVAVLEAVADEQRPEETGATGSRA
jgi:hypothetical protein